jgi:predicted nucleic acid-binding Zn ribbon protein
MKTLGDILKATIKDLGIEKPIQQYEALVIWPKVVGDKIASVTEPRHIANGKLFIKVKNAAWRNELIFHRSDLIKKLNEQIGRAAVRDIILI